MTKHSNNEKNKRMSFVEDKAISLEGLMKTLAPAINANHHTNFGPVSLSLEKELLQLNGGTTNKRAACCTASGTLALETAVSLFTNYLNRPIRWAISDFGFMTSFIGPFTNQQIVECGADGFISMEHLQSLDPQTFDAVMVTNNFGMHENFDALFDYCRQTKKLLLVDNAAGFGALAPYHETTNDSFIWAEIISLHYTKPWGMGEGGAIFLPAFLLPMCRSSLNFGVETGRFLNHLEHCTNGKMSEIAAAQILQRVQNHLQWVPAYREQAARILKLGKEAGLEPLIPTLPARAVPGHIPFQSSRSVTMEELQTANLPLMKYYRPGPMA